jgi:Vps16, C-terminal region
MRDFEGLETFSRSKRSPIGYEAFVRHLVEKGHAKEAVSYVQRCDANKRVDLYVECGEWVMAGKECKERGDRARIECVSSGRFSLRKLLTGAVQEVAWFMSQLVDRPGVGSDRIHDEMNTPALLDNSKFFLPILSHHGSGSPILSKA